MFMFIQTSKKVFKYRFGYFFYIINRIHWQTSFFTPLERIMPFFCIFKLSLVGSIGNADPDIHTGNVYRLMVGRRSDYGCLWRSYVLLRDPVAR